ncbi:MAG: xanthine dehydrogenase family protein subunit M [Deltaproteobacteria bacterium]|nr:MAG: xanthine dehydrogenase family protein subunit M [Deltaproteobacteria bacterium]RLA98264.1 MAG: xanthine dehydrogenase family protein subunit M [Deltaproteobacteria bacterium]
MIRYDYLKPSSLEEAIGLLKQYGGQAKLIAGGTDVMVGIRQKKYAPQVLISLRGIEGLSYIREEDGGLRIGALTTHRELEKSPLVRERLGALADAVDNLGSVQIRNVATIGGNICNAAPSADTAPPLLVLGASVRIKGSEGERVLPLEEFFLGPGETALKDDEILVEFIIPSPPPNSASAYWKHTRRQAMDLPIIGVAMMLAVEKTEAPALKEAFGREAPLEELLGALDESELVCQEVRLALGVAAPTPMRASKAEEFLRGKRVTQEALLQFGEIASSEATPRDTVRGAAWYRREMIKVLPKRLALKCLERIMARE